MKKSILLSLVLAGVLSANCISNGDETVTCSDTELTWQDNADVGNVSKAWKEAIDYCENLSLAGKSDWRLPNIRELRSIIDKNNINVLKDGFTQRSTNWFWSSTTYSSRPSCAWSIKFFEGYNGWHNKFNHSSVRCVR